LRKTRSAPAQVDSATNPQPAAARGRKKLAALSKPIVPEERKCFRGKTFCQSVLGITVFLCGINCGSVFCPNETIHPARKLRVEKVIDHGGQRLMEWSPWVDYVVLDRTLCYNDLIKWLKLEVIPVCYP
jgi:hypothetical protein